MEEIAGNDKESKLLKLLKQQNERIQKLEAELKEKEMLIKSLRQEQTKPWWKNGIQKIRNKFMKEQSTQPLEQSTSNDKLADAVKKCLQISLILTEILRNVRTGDLIQNCRLVNREWRDLSTEILLKRKNIQVRFHESGSEFIFPQQNVPVKKKLDELTKLLTTSTMPTFPSANFEFCGNISSEDVQTFLSKFGSTIKGLFLGGSQDMKFIRKLLVEQVPNLTHLHMESVKAEGELFPSELFTQAPKLLFLISLELEHGSSSSLLITGIVDAAPNLQHCSGFESVNEIQFLLPRIQILKDLKLSPQPNELEALKNFSEQTPQLQLTSLSLDCWDWKIKPSREIVEEFERYVAKILFSSSSTLREIKLTGLRFNSLQKWPVLEKVEKLVTSGLIFPCFKISQVFPNLHNLSVLTTITCDTRLPSSFGFLNDRCPTVKSLTISGSLVKVFPHFYQSFPNINCLLLEYIEGEEFLTISPVIWNMKRLRILKLTVKTCVLNRIAFDTTDFHAAFTGIVKTIIDSLQGPEANMMEDSEVEGFRLNPSILNLTELEELHLIYAQRLNDGVFEKEKTRSSMSFKFAFNRMPKLRVLFSRFHSR